MRTVDGPALTPVPHDAHVLRPLLDRWASEPNSVVAARRVGDRFVDLTVGELVDQVRLTARGLIASGVAPGDRVALMSHTRLEWLVVDFAIIAAGGVTVPIYDTSSVDQVRWILQDSAAVLAVAETMPMFKDLELARVDTATCREVLTIDEGGLDELVRRGEPVADVTIDERLATLDVDTIATIIYTSGTTGRPKGCVLTHGNLASNVEQTWAALRSQVRAGDTGLLFLPLAHSLTKGNALLDIRGRVTIGFATDVAHLPDELQRYMPTTLAAVPRIFEKVFNSARRRAHAEHKGRLFDRATEAAIQWSRERVGGRLRPWTAAEHAVWDLLVYTKIRGAFGGRMRLCFSGGGPLGERLTHFFAGVGVQIFEGYGLTETSPTLTLNRPDAWKPGTVGRPVAGTSIAIAGDGEILAKGPQVFRGYWHNDAATAEAFDDDGWFHSGDIGEIDEEGFVRITGRKKELIVTAAGKNVAPAPLEDHLRSHELISQAVVIGDARPFIAALITVDATVLPAWAAEHGLTTETDGELLATEALHAAIQDAIDRANSTVSRAESIRNFAILPTDLSIESGELTPTFKVRRSVVEAVYAAQIDQIYDA